jgi:uncharacterized membrane protein YjfL (UPF0719 family)
MLVVNLVYAVVALFVGVAALRLLDRLLLRKMDLESEIQKGNVAASIFASVLVIFVALIVGLALAK